MSSINKNLLGLLANGEPDIISKQFKNRIEEIKEAKRNGFSNNQIILALRRDGIYISQSTFRSYLSRYKSTTVNKKSVNKSVKPETKTAQSPNHTNDQPNISNNPDIIKNIKSSNQNLEALTKLFEGIK